jgi:hypothetical protein
MLSAAMEWSLQGRALLKVHAFRNYGVVFTRSCAVESACFPQLWSGLKMSRAEESEDFPQLTGVFQRVMRW